MYDQFAIRYLRDSLPLGAALSGIVATVLLIGDRTDNVLVVAGALYLLAAVFLLVRYELLPRLGISLRWDPDVVAALTAVPTLIVSTLAAEMDPEPNAERFVNITLALIAVAPCFRRTRSYLAVTAVAVSSVTVFLAPEIPFRTLIQFVIVGPGVALVLRLAFHRAYSEMQRLREIEQQSVRRQEATLQSLRTSERTLKERTAQLDALLQNAPHAIWTLDARGVITLARGKALPDLLGADQDIAGRQIAEICAGESEAAAIAARKALAGQSVEFLCVIGGKRFEVRYQPRLNAEAQPDGAIAVALDVTDRYQLESQLFDAQKHESLGLMAAGIAHDFNNYLLAILALTESLDPNDPESLRSDQNDLRQIAQSAAQVCERMTTYAGHAPHEMKTVSARGLLADAEPLIRAIVPRTARVDIEAPNDVFVTADPAQLQQAILNLVSNAVTALGARDGWIRISARAETYDLSRTGAKWIGPPAAEQPAFILQVEDNGRGIEADALDRVFDPYFTTDPKGHGFGLPVTLGIVRRHAGSVAARSAPGHGTAIELVLPILSEATEAAPEQPTAERPSPRRKTEMTVLLVDDDDAVRRSVGRMLRAAGFSVVEAEDGPSAIELLSSGTFEFDVILLDYAMPRMTGGDVLRELRGLGVVTPVILSSGLMDSPDVEIAVRSPESPAALNPDAYLQKPYDLNELRSTLAQVLG